MITCKLSEILGRERKNRVWLSKKAGVSINTLKPLYDDTWKGIQRKTINSICKALDLSPGELFEIVPNEDEK